MLYLSNVPCANWEVRGCGWIALYESAPIPWVCEWNKATPTRTLLTIASYLCVCYNSILLVLTLVSLTYIYLPIHYPRPLHIHPYILRAKHNTSHPIRTYKHYIPDFSILAIRNIVWVCSKAWQRIRTTFTWKTLIFASNRKISFFFPCIEGLFLHTPHLYPEQPCLCCQGSALFSPNHKSHKQ